jgi:hypothetical protein
MRNLRSVLFCLLIAVSFYTFAQSGDTTPNSLNPGSYSSTTTVKHAKKKKKIHFFSPRREKAYARPNVKHTARYEFYERVEQAAREKQRILKELSKKQYSDPRYFGHKRIPKRRSPNKMRYCSECGIRH